MGSAGGAVVIGSGFAPSAGATPTSNSTVGGPEPVAGDKLERLVQSPAGKADIVNLMGSDWRATVRNSAVEELSSANRSGNDERPQKQYKLDFDEGVVIVGAAKHVLSNGNEMTAVAFVNEDSAVAYYEYGAIEQGVKSKAKRWKITGAESIEDARLVTVGTSVNGEVTKSPREFNTTSSCPGCEPGPAGGGYRTIEEECVEIDYFCAGSCCAACTGASLCGPYALYCGIACVATWCGGCLGYCCTEHETTCQYCPGLT